MRGILVHVSIVLHTECKVNVPIPKYANGSFCMHKRLEFHMNIVNYLRYIEQRYRCISIYRNISPETCVSRPNRKEYVIQLEYALLFLITRT